MKNIPRTLAPPVDVPVRFSARDRRSALNLLGRREDDEQSDDVIAGIERLLSTYATQIANAGRSTAHPSDTLAALRPVRARAEKLVAEIEAMDSMHRENLVARSELAREHALDIESIDFGAFMSTARSMLDDINAECARWKRKSKRGLELKAFRDELRNDLAAALERAFDARSQTVGTGTNRDDFVATGKSAVAAAVADAVRVFEAEPT
jgi:hypothetical protein